MSKTTLGTALVLTFALSIAACSKEPQAPAPTATTPSAPAAAMPAPHPIPAAPADEVDLSGIAKAEGGRTIAEVFADRAGLAGQAVVFRGKVVKVNPDIMGRHWLHVRDGSGAEGTNDLTVTTTGELPNVGDTVLVTGTIAIDKDFGMGYRYDIIVEDAEVQVESAY